MGLVCIQNSSLLVYSKSQKVSASYCLLFQHSRGKNQPVGGFRPPPACLGLSNTNQNLHKVKLCHKHNWIQSIDSVNSFNSIWTVLFANLKRLGEGAKSPPLPLSQLGYFKSDDDETRKGILWLEIFRN